MLNNFLKQIVYLGSTEAGIKADARFCLKSPYFNQLEFLRVAPVKVIRPNVCPITGVVIIYIHVSPKRGTNIIVATAGIFKLPLLRVASV